MEYTALIEECKEGGFVAQCAQMRNAFAQGETIEEAQENLKEVIRLLMECEQEQQEKIIVKSAHFYRAAVVL
ncbi:MAG: type II toxin-antitoxin system HicB family antitoxin [Tannerella sp.]|jgi:predicted RNase H-like HicB family nuclease|nr:type II toxin-antitoxin system HicB family antitoxin [Tannerella sp.]